MRKLTAACLTLCAPRCPSQSSAGTTCTGRRWCRGQADLGGRCRWLLSQSPTLPHLCNCFVAAPPASPCLSLASVGFNPLQCRAVSLPMSETGVKCTFFRLSPRDHLVYLCVAVECCTARARRSLFACLAVLRVYLSVSYCRFFVDGLFCFVWVVH